MTYECMGLISHHTHSNCIVTNRLGKFDYELLMAAVWVPVDWKLANKVWCDSNCH